MNKFEKSNWGNLCFNDQLSQFLSDTCFCSSLSKERSINLENKSKKIYVTIPGAFLYICFFFYRNHKKISEVRDLIRPLSWSRDRRGVILWKQNSRFAIQAKITLISDHNRGTMDAGDEVYSQSALKEIGWWFPDLWCHDLLQIVWNSGSPPILFVCSSRAT